MVQVRLVDSSNRRLSYFRISVTDRCNLRCLYCAPNGCMSKLDHGDILSYEEILRLVKIGVSLGIDKVRITGGEPLVRKGLSGFISDLSAINGLVDVSLTTNGVLLASKAEKIKKAGISRINVSLDTLSSKKYENITGYDEFMNVWDGIMLAYKLGFNPIKINVVVIKGFNDNEIIDFGKLSLKYPFHVRFIEYMPVGITEIGVEDQVLTPVVKSVLSSVGVLRSVKNSENDGPAERFKFNEGIGEIGFISALSHYFCDKCNRLRLTADGKLRACLFSDKGESLKNLIRAGCSDSELIDVFLRSVYNKDVGHYLLSDQEKFVRKQMYMIGG